MNALSILLYFIIFFIVAIAFSYDVEHGGRCLVFNEKKRGSLWLIFLVSIIVTLYNVYCTVNSTPIPSRSGSDRYNYYIEFLGKRKSSVGLTFVFENVKKVTCNFDYVLYITSFLCCGITLYSYRITDEKSLYALIFLLFTDIVFTMFIHLKQCYAAAFISLMVSIALGEHSLFKDLLCLACIVAALQFHAVAVIAFPVFLLLRFNSWQNNCFTLVCIIVAILFLSIESTSLAIAKLIESVYPYGADKILEYFSSGTAHTNEGSLFSFIKGVPFYVIAVVGFLKRKELKERYKNYDNYLFLAIMGAFFYLLSIASYWMYRATSIFYLPISIFFGILCKEMDSKEKTVFVLIVLIPHSIILIRWMFLMCVNYGSL